MAGSRSRRWSAWWIVGVAAASTTGAVVVSTWVLRLGASSSHAAVRWIFYPTQEVVCLRA